MTPSELRDLIGEVAGYRCEWPDGVGGSCDEPMAELAHLHSAGMGGRPSAHRPGNVMAACEPHARCSDLLPPAGGNRDDLHVELAKVPGLDETDGNGLGYELAEALTAWITQLRDGGGD